MWSGGVLCCCVGVAGSDVQVDWLVGQLCDTGTAEFVSYGCGRDCVCLGGGRMRLGERCFLGGLAGDRGNVSSGGVLDGSVTNRHTAPPSRLVAGPPFGGAMMVDFRHIISFKFSI